MDLRTTKSKNDISESLIDLECTFESMGLDIKILKAVKKMGFQNPTLVQSKSIPLSLQGKDILAKARTGSGKTAAYSIPIIQKILISKEKSNQKGIKAVVLVPTRELCEQVKNHFVQVSYYASNLINIIQLGSDKSVDEQRGLLRDIPDIVISTPTRLVQHLQSKAIQLQNTLEMLVIDEADLVLSYGHKEDINQIKSYLPKVCQCFLMSATLTAQVEELKKLVLHTPAILKLEEDSVQQSNLSEYSIKCAEVDKFLLVFSLLKLRLMQGKILFFVNDTDNCYKLKLFLERFHIKSAVINSELPINSRHDIILQFNKGLFDYLIATDESFKSSSSMEIKDEEIKKESNDSDDEDPQDSDEEDQEFDIKRKSDNSDNEEEEEDDNDDENENENDEEEDQEFDIKEEISDDDDDDDDDDDEEEDNEKIDDDSDEENNDFDNNNEDDDIEIKDEPISDEENENVKENTAKKMKNSKVDTEYGVARGIDFKNVDIIVNFDFPRTIKNYIHRIGRTARGTNKGIALSFVTHSNEELLEMVHKKRSESGYNLKPFEFKMGAIEGFRYRVEDVLQTVSKSAIKEARKVEIKNEIFNSEKLKSHFSENPQDLLALKHDTTLIKKKVSNHLRHLPDYLLPNQFKQTANNKLQVIQSNIKKNANDQTQKPQKKKKDVLKTFNYTNAKKNLSPEEFEKERDKSLIRKYKLTEDDIHKSGGLKKKFKSK
ncbi:putative RNA helicase [Tieghemostelium lacteum]|uniref:RNA helicase n=1 Tax=Tieghemostelium lacteum TaxID=361077 RepID=A0A152A1M2_TIELA|nr:putative RNA helicase [Tieghemostelium lacteum]|eukprot:KYQ99970.1 putative RNA helicase [Tieghemostelium lacteum]